MKFYFILKFSANDEGVNEDSVRRYLKRKPMTTTELLQNYTTKKTALSESQLVHDIAKTLEKMNLVKETIKGEIYLSLQDE